MAPWGLLGHSSACNGLSQPFEQALQLGLAVFETPDPFFETPDPIGQLLDVVPQPLFHLPDVLPHPFLGLRHIGSQPGKQPDQQTGEGNPNSQDADQFRTHARSLAGGPWHGRNLRTTGCACMADRVCCMIR